MRKLALGLLLGALFLTGCGGYGNNNGGGGSTGKTNTTKGGGYQVTPARYRRRGGRPLLGELRPALQRVPRRGVGLARAGRAGALRAPLPRGLPVGALVADDPAQARRIPGRLRGLRP